MCRRFPCCYSFTRRGGQRRRQAHRRGKLNGIWILPVWCMQPCRTSGRVYILPPLIKIDEWLVASRGVFKSNASALHHDPCTVLFFFSFEMIHEYIYIHTHIADRRATILDVQEMVVIFSRIRGLWLGQQTRLQLDNKPGCHVGMPCHLS